MIWNFFRSFVLLFAFSCVFYSCKNEIIEKPVEEFFSKENKIDFSLSPDGKYIAYLSKYGGKTNLFMRSATDTAQKPVKLSKGVHTEIKSYSWVGSSRLVFFQDSARNGIYKMYSVTIDGKKPKIYSPPAYSAELISPLIKSDSLVLISLSAIDSLHPGFFAPPHAYLFNLHSGRYFRVAYNFGGIKKWIADNSGRVRIGLGVSGDGLKTNVYYRDTSSSFRLANSIPIEDFCSYESFSLDNKSVYVISNVNRDKMALLRINPISGEILDSIYANDKYDIHEVLFSELQGKPLVISCKGHKGDVVHIADALTSKMYKNIKALLPEEEYFRIVSMNLEENKIIVLSQSDRNPGIYYLYDTKENRLDKIEERIPGVKIKKMSKVIPVVFKTRDDLILEAYLTLPQGISFEDARELPLVLLPHDGPWERDAWEYSSIVQLLANRRFAVFQINYRGSSGYGKSFTERSIGEWGLKMQNDLNDGVVWLLEKRIAKAGKIAIYGRGYGGYAALKSLEDQPYLYACAACRSAILNPLSYVHSLSENNDSYKQQLYTMLGNPKKDSLKFEAMSVIPNLDSISSPLLMFTDRERSIYKKEEDLIVERLKSKEIAIEKKEIENEEVFYKELISFLRKNIGRS